MFVINENIKSPSISKCAEIFESGIKAINETEKFIYKAITAKYELYTQ